ncbi:putative pinE invertase/site-specific DNA recombinase [Escherichia coli]|nr:putative pinE invertase/site-specific DNA recombinase [Escherichia coli]SQP67778.1 putative pinE invertase/site-specific DNA recombinase [Escherichia coli]SQP67781.1 putative pinE invertase/site-specific DNA recombinase [Escherichia coli]SQZ55714.1 putative pinE invertase/site-specific DNA recombinase [Escherichia coli]SQZ89616.1 putative pinE invertase/site-specific DNA recombinase [Escherichia coli]
MLIGYVRVSTNDQNTDLQRNALNCAGCELIFEDKISGTKSERPGLKKLLRTLSEGDTLVVWKLDRLGAVCGILSCWWRSCANEASTFVV